MTDNRVSRRNFIIGGSAVLAAPLAKAQPATQLTAGQLVERIRAHVGVPWRTPTVDRILAGNADIAVRGVAVTMMATLDVIQRAVASGKNMIVTHEPTFYVHQDTTAELGNDPTLKYKLDFIRKHDVAVFRFHDHWHARHPDGIAVGMMQQLGWEKNVVDPSDPKRFLFNGEPLAQFCQVMQSRLQDRTMRVVGKPTLPVRKVAASWGAGDRLQTIPLLARPDVDVLVVGEAREWELVEYAQDSITAGNQKALVILGHVVSEQGGMKYCTEWLKSFVTDVPVEFVPAVEPFWNPAHPVEDQG
ncbi:MAG: Nif3-like dinuclear metal center hexameric protein [Acidobacteriaceae bacterium]